MKTKNVSHIAEMSRIVGVEHLGKNNEHLSGQCGLFQESMEAFDFAQPVFEKQKKGLTPDSDASKIQVPFYHVTGQSEVVLVSLCDVYPLVAEGETSRVICWTDHQIDCFNGIDQFARAFKELVSDEGEPRKSHRKRVGRCDQDQNYKADISP